MRILFLSPRLCLPLHTGARIREYHLARALARHAEVTYVSFIQPGFSEPPAADLAFFHKACLVPVTGRYSLAKIAAGLLDRRPLSVLNYTTPEMKSAVTGLAKGANSTWSTSKAAIWWNMSTSSKPCGDICSRGPYWHNIESELMYRYAGTVKSVARKVYANITAGRLKRLEGWILKHGFGHVVCSQRGKDQLLGIAPDARFAVIGNGVDTGYFAPVAETVPRRRLLYVGTMEYYPNVEAATWFTKRIWPRIRERFPEWQLTLVGAKPVPAVCELRNEPGVEVTGTVPDVRPYYRDAVASIVPIHTGSGTRLKSSKPWRQGCR